MTKTKITGQIIQELADKIAREYQPDKIILFGSYALGTYNEDSDLDFFIIKETDNTRITAREIDGSIFPRYVPIDIIVYTPEQVRRNMVSDFFINDILTKGKVLYDGSGRKYI